MGLEPHIKIVKYLIGRLSQGRPPQLPEPFQPSPSQPPGAMLTTHTSHTSHTFSLQQPEDLQVQFWPRPAAEHVQLDPGNLPRKGGWV